MKLVNIYATSFYSSSLWNLSSTYFERVNAAWNNAIRMIYNVPRTTHTYLIEDISDGFHVTVMIASRLIQFHKTLIENKKSVLRLLASLNMDDVKTIHGRNLAKLKKSLNCEITDMSSNFIKTNLRYKYLPALEEWRVPLLKNLLDIRNNDLELNGFEKTEINSMIEDICTN